MNAIASILAVTLGPILWLLVSWHTIAHKDGFYTMDAILLAGFAQLILLGASGSMAAATFQETRSIGKSLFSGTTSAIYMVLFVVYLEWDTVCLIHNTMLGR